MYKFLQVLQTDPSTPPAGTGRWSTITALNFKAWDLRKAFVDAFSGSTGTPLYRDDGTPIPNHHVRVVPATPQFQRKLELPLRVLLHVINNSEVLEGKQVVILWRALTIMSPQKVRAFDEQATACARLQYFEEDGISRALLRLAQIW